MSYTIHTYKPCETFRMHIRLPRWPTVDFRPGRELTFALPLCCQLAQRFSLSRSSLAIPLFSRSSAPPRRSPLSSSRSSPCASLPSRVSRVSSFFPANFSFVSYWRLQQCIGRRVEVSGEIFPLRIYRIATLLMRARLHLSSRGTN